MSGTLEIQLLILGVLLLVSILVSKISDRFGVPTLLLFLVIGMLAGSDGPGGLYFDNAVVAQAVGVICLAIILFSGGLDTDWQSIRPVLKPGVILALVGVLLTALIVGYAAYIFFDITLLEGMLVGAIVSSTDAAAVFSILRSRGVSLKGRLRPLLELESGSNDPMAIFLTVGMIQLLQNPGLSPVELFSMFLQQMGVGALVGLFMGWFAVRLINRIDLGYDGLYPVLTLAVALLTYSVAGSLRGSGFLAVYLAGLLMGNSEFIHRRSMLRFFDGLAWLMQIALFLTLGLLVFPSRLVSVAGQGLLIAAILMFVARPLSVFISLLPVQLKLSEKVFVAWVGLRGAAPIVLATFPLMAGVAQSETIFNLVFFVVLTSVLIQGPSIPVVARWLGLDAPLRPKRDDPIEPGPAEGNRGRLRELYIPAGSKFAGKKIVELGLPANLLVILIDRDGEFIIASGGTELHADDRLLVISDDEAFEQVQNQLSPV